MKLFGLTPSQVVDRSNHSSPNDRPSLLYSILFGGIGFGIVSVLAYSIWAFRIVRGQGPMYTTIALVYLGLAGLVFGRLLVAPKTQWRFSLLFAAAFAVYAIVWCVFWFGLTARYHSDLYGSAVGLLLFALLFNRSFGASERLFSTFAVLFAFHTLGYYIGDDLNNAFGGRAGKLLWGAAHGVGFGAGIGYLLYHCQTPLSEVIQNSDTEES